MTPSETKRQTLPPEDSEQLQGRSIKTLNILSSINNVISLGRNRTYLLRTFTPMENAMTSKNNASILLLEDEAIIVVDMETYLRDAGFVIAGSFASCSAALGWLTTSRPDVALLDVRVADGDSVEVARKLRGLGVPVIVYSGMTFDPDTHDPVFADIPWMSKPRSPDEIVQHIVSALGGTGLVKSSGRGLPTCPEAGKTQRRAEAISEPKRRVQLTKAQKRVQMEVATRAAFEDAERRRVHNAAKTERLRALRLAAVDHGNGASVS